MQVFPSDTIALFYDILSNLPRYCFESRLQFVLDNGTVLEPGTPFAEYDLEANPHVTTRYALYGEPEVRVHVNGLRKILSNHVIDQNKFTNMSVYSRIAHQAVEKGKKYIQNLIYIY